MPCPLLAHLLCLLLCSQKLMKNTILLQVHLVQCVHILVPLACKTIVAETNLYQNQRWGVAIHHAQAHGKHHV